MPSDLTLLFVCLTATLSMVCGQYSGSGSYVSNSPCDHYRLQRCQQDITQNIQDLSSSQSSGYSGLSSGYQSNSGDTYQRCSALRQNLDCLLVQSPPCVFNRSISYDTRNQAYDNQRSNPGDFVRRGKSTIERYCEQSGQGWKSASCYQRQDVRQCESQFGFSTNPAPVSTSACRNYQDFRDCVIRVVRQSCYSQDLQLMAIYLIDKAQDLSWSCMVQGSDYNNPSRMDPPGNDPYRGSGSGYHPSYESGNRYGSGVQYDRDRPPYDRNYDANRPYDPNRPDLTRDGYGSQSGGYYGSGGQYQGSQYGSTYGSGGYGSNGYASNQPLDRLGAAGYVGGMPTTDSCLERSGYYVRSCEDTLIQRQRDAREGRSSNDVQRRICCALFFYRDCISRVVVDRCRDPSPVVVDVLMGSRKRDLSVTCREYSRDQCSSSSLIKSSLISFIFVCISVLFSKLKTI